GTAVADPGEVESYAKTATSALDDVYPDDWKAGTAEADFDVIATLLRKVTALATTGDMRRAESSRLEAYATFELAETMAALDLALKESAEAIGSGPQSRTTVVVNSAIIVFREGLEAVLILAALMASMVG